MATIDLGKLGFVNKGTYSSSTSYEKNDLVQYTDSGILSTYLYINSSAATGQTPSTSGTVNGTYWAYFAKGVADAVSSAGNNKVLVTDGSGNLSPISIGSAGQVLKTNSSANGFEFGTDAGGSILAVSTKMYGGTNEINTTNRETNYANIASNSYEISALTITMTPSASTSKFLIQMHLQASHEDNYVGFGWLTYQVSGGTEYAITSDGSRGVTFRHDEDDTGSSNMGSPSQAHCVMVAPNTTSAVTFRVRIASASSSHPWWINRTPGNNTDVDDGGYTLSTMTVFELDGSKSTKAVTTVNETKT